MHFSQATIALVAAAGFATAAPVEKTPAINDGDILNYALTLEHLEDKFYRDGLKRFSKADFAAAGFDATFYSNVQKVSEDETTHVSFLTTALKGAKVTPVAECVYDFGVTDVKSFVATASILEGVGVSAYLGAAASIMNKAYLTAAGSILTVEARHSSYIRAAQKQVPFPQAFDAPLGLNEVFSLASQFIKSCPKENPALPVKAFPKLVVHTTGTLKTGSTVVLKAPAGIKKVKAGSKIYAAFIAVTGPVYVPVLVGKDGYQITIPKGFAGQTYVVFTNCNTGVSDDTVVAGPAILEISS